MPICKEILKDIWGKMFVKSPRVGGIRGGQKGKVCPWKYDSGYGERECIHKLNVNYLNTVMIGSVK